MAKTYMNRAERDLYLKIGAAVQVLDDMEDAFTKQNNVAALKSTRHARTLMQKIFNSRIAELENVAALKLVAESEATKIMLRTENYKVSVDAPEDEGMAEIPRAWYFSLVEDALAQSCALCRMRGELVKECERRKMFVLSDVPLLNAECDADRCPYQRR